MVRLPHTSYQVMVHRTYGMENTQNSCPTTTQEAFLAPCFKALTALLAMRRRYY